MQATPPANRNGLEEELDGVYERQSETNPRSVDKEGSEDETSGLDLLCLADAAPVTLSVGHTGDLAKELYEHDTTVRPPADIAEGRVQWYASQISEWCQDSDESGDIDQGEKDDFNGG